MHAHAYARVLARAAPDSRCAPGSLPSLGAESSGAVPFRHFIPFRSIPFRSYLSTEEGPLLGVVETQLGHELGQQPALRRARQRGLPTPARASRNRNRTRKR
jgi:hypothetical protein